MWRFQAGFSAPAPAYLLPTPSGRLFLGAAGALYEWTSSGPVLLDTIAGSQLYISELAEDAEGTVWFRSNDSPASDVYRLSHSRLEKVLVDQGSSSGFLDAHITSIAGRVLMMRDADIWGYDKAQERFVLVDPKEFAVPGDAVTTLHVLDPDQTLLQVYQPEDGTQSLTIFSHRHKDSHPLPVLPDNRELKFAVADDDGNIWASDFLGEYVYRFHSRTGWVLVLGPGEQRKRLEQDSLRISAMIPAPEGAIFIQQHNGPLLRFLPPSGKHQ